MLLDIAIQASISAGKEILTVYNTGNFDIQIKNDNSPLTLADKKSHDLITEHLKATGLPVLSEEGKDISYEERKSWEYFWLVDPLDGTKEFIKRNDEFTVNIALIKEGTPVLGVIYAPVLNLLYFAERTAGSYKAEVTGADENINMAVMLSKAVKLPVNNKTHKFTAVSSRSHMNQITQLNINELKKRYGDIDIISRGSSLKLCMIAEGTADIYPRFGPTMEWDTAAGHAIIKYSGGKMIRADNSEELIYNKEDLHNPFFVAYKG